MIVWLEREAVLAIHDRQVAEHGGGEGLRDPNLLESALARPQQLAHYSSDDTDLAALAASLTFGLARNHPFVDGNKRTAWVCCSTFLVLNGCRITASIEDKYVTILSLAEGHLPEAEFAQWLRDNTQTVAMTVQEPKTDYSAAK